MRNIDTLMKKTMPMKWYDWKQKKIFEAADKEVAAIYGEEKNFLIKAASKNGSPFLFHSDIYPSSKSTFR